MLVKPIIGVTMGDPAGIGPEICVKALISPEVQIAANSLVIGDRKCLQHALKTAKISDVKINPIKKVTEAKYLRGTIDVLDLDNVEISHLKIGQISKAAGRAGFEYVEKAIQLAMDGKIDAIATGPINKEAVQKAGIKFTGHTELLAARTKTNNYAMMFASDSLWVALVTVHIALSEVSRSLDKSKIIKVIKLAHETLLKLRGKKPRIGVAGLNPHAGEGGMFGTEEIKIIKPAVDEARKLGNRGAKDS